MYIRLYIGMSCPSWQWHRIGGSWSPIRTLPVAPLWCDLGFFPNSCGNKAAANLRPIWIYKYMKFRYKFVYMNLYLNSSTPSIHIWIRGYQGSTWSYKPFFGYIICFIGPKPPPQSRLLRIQPKGQTSILILSLHRRRLRRHSRVFPGPTVQFTAGERARRGRRLWGCSTCSATRTLTPLSEPGCECKHCKAADLTPPADLLNLQGALPLHSGHKEEKAELLRNVN